MILVFVPSDLAHLAHVAFENARRRRIAGFTQGLRGWRNTSELALFDISNSMKPHPSAFDIYP